MFDSGIRPGDGDSGPIVVAVDSAAIRAAIGYADRLQAGIVDALGRFDVAGLWEPDGSTSLTAWLRDHGGYSTRQAMTTVKVASRLRHLPLTAAAFACGELNRGQVDAIVTALPPRLVDKFAAVEAGLIPTLGPLSAAETNLVMQEWKARAEPQGPEPDDQIGKLHVSKVGDRVVLNGEFDALHGEIIATALREADSHDPERTVSQRQAQALDEICRQYLDHHQAKPGQRHRPHLNVIVNLKDLLGGGPGSTVEGTPIPGPILAALACDSNLHRWIFNAKTGKLEYGHSTRSISPELFNAIAVRDRQCRFPGCDRPVHWCDGHHLKHYEDNGPTEPQNVVLMCSKHHHLLHKKDWLARMEPDGTVIVTDPQGRQRVSRPPGHLWAAA